MRRVLPAIALFFVAPLVAEFLLGDLPITMLGSLIVLAPAYGGGALLIREVVRRAGRGWASILVLALAYAILEEAFLTQTLFNPDYLGLNLHLLQPGPDGVLGSQTLGAPGDLAFALQSRKDRAIAALNTQPNFFNGAYINQLSALDGGDPFTPMIRAYAGLVLMMDRGFPPELNAAVVTVWRLSNSRA